MYQPYLITQILEAIDFNEKTKDEITPALASKILFQDIKGDQTHSDWEYARGIMHLNFLENINKA